jgi:hypothetical protein
MRVAPAQMQRFTTKEGVGEDVGEDDVCTTSFDVNRIRLISKGFFSSS